MFEGFTLDRVNVGEVELRVRYGGAGPAVGHGISSTQHLAEQAPTELINALRTFL